MAYYGRRRRYRSWRSRGFTPSKYSVLRGLFGDAVSEIRSAFLDLDPEALDELLMDYGCQYGANAERYARNTHPIWKSGERGLSGQTMERLVELVPPYLSASQRFSILEKVASKYKHDIGRSRTITVNMKDPTPGFIELDNALASMNIDNELAHIPERVMKAACWLYDDDMTAARAMLAEVERRENELIKTSARKEIELLKHSIRSEQVKSANYSVTMPAGTLHVSAFTPSKCFVATVCFGQDAHETWVLRRWRDEVLIQSSCGRTFIAWYYHHGEHFGQLVEDRPLIKHVVRGIIGIAAKLIGLTQQKDPGV